jgi:hypothetical protein
MQERLLVASLIWALQEAAQVGQQYFQHHLKWQDLQVV